MHDDTIGGDDRLQGAVAQARPKIIWRDNRPFVIDDLEPDGVVRIVPLRLVPNALFRSGVNLPLPDWTFDSPDIIDNPPLQLLALNNALIEQRRDAIAALRDIRIPLKAARILIEEGVGPSPVAQRLDDAIKRVNALSAVLDI